MAISIRGGGGHNCLCICDEYAKMISELPLLSRQLKSHGNSLNCHGKVMELIYQISVGTLILICLVVE